MWAVSDVDVVMVWDVWLQAVPHMGGSDNVVLLVYVLNLWLWLQLSCFSVHISRSGSLRRSLHLWPCGVWLLMLSSLLLSVWSSQFVPCGAGAPSPFPLVHLLHHLLFFLLFPFFQWLYLFSSFVHPFPFYQNSPSHSISRLEVVGGDRTWV